MDSVSVNRDVLAGDPFPLGATRSEDAHEDVEAHYAALERLDAPHGCISGVVYLGELVIGEGGEEEEVLHPVLCRHCHGETR